VRIAAGKTMTDTVSWCDKLASIPTVGITLSPRYHSPASLLEAMTPILDSHVTAKSNFQPQTRFNIERQDVFELAFSVEEGFRYGFGPTSARLTFSIE
jgi:hypothetical protein